MASRPVAVRGARLLVTLAFGLATTLLAGPSSGGTRPVGRERIPRDLIILSDLHIGEGASSALEDFTVDEAFSDLVDHVIAQGIVRGRPSRVVFNGDTFDFLKVIATPAGEARPTKGPMVGSSGDVAPNQTRALQKMRRILEAHPLVFQAMARLVANGHPIVFVAGNHDQELSFPRVRRLLREHLRTLSGVGQAQAIRFNPHFYLHRDVLVEHGQRYEAANSVHAMSWPFDGEGPERRLRPAASNYLVVEAANPLRRKLPHITQLRRGLPQLLEAVRGAPEFIPSWLALLARMAFRVGRESPEAQAYLEKRHQRVVRAQLRLNDMRRQVNETRAGRGLPPLSDEALVKLLLDWDRTGAEPWLRGAPRERGIIKASFQRLREATRVVQPGALRHWTHADETSRLREGQDFALKHFANVVVQGHTHRAAFEGALANSGTWTPSAPDRGERWEPTANLTYVEVNRDEVALRRWDAQRKRPAIPRRTFPARAPTLSRP